MTALLTLSVAHAQVFTSTFNKGISVKINDHFDSDPATPNHNAINYVHYNKACQADLALTAVATGWASQNHMITANYRFQHGDL